MQKYEWGGVVCSTPKTREAVHSWFEALVPDAWGLPLKADVQEEVDTGRETAMRALYRSPDNRLWEVLRRKNRSGWTMTRRPASPGILKGFRAEEAA